MAPLLDVETARALQLFVLHPPRVGRLTRRTSSCTLVSLPCRSWPAWTSSSTCWSIGTSTSPPWSRRSFP